MIKVDCRLIQLLQDNNLIIYRNNNFMLFFLASSCLFQAYI